MSEHPTGLTVASTYFSSDLVNSGWPFISISGKLAELHLNYEQIKECPLKFIEAEGVPLSYSVANKMKLSKDKTSLRVNDSLTLEPIPPDVFEYRLGNRSALEWVIDQYRVAEDARSIAPDAYATGLAKNCQHDPEYIVRLVGQVIRVSVETVKIVKVLPEEFTDL